MLLKRHVFLWYGRSKPISSKETPTEIRFGAFVREITLQQQRISYNNLTPKVWRDADGAEIPYQAPKIRLRWVDAYRLIQPYISSRLMEQLKAVIPLAAYLILFQVFILQQAITDAGIISGGLLVAVILGLMFFLEGLKVGLMPFGEMLGNTLPAKATLPIVLIIALLLGIGVTPLLNPRWAHSKRRGKLST